MKPCHVLNFLVFQAVCSYMVCSYKKTCSFIQTPTSWSEFDLKNL